MKITYNGKTINCLTIKELYEMAVKNGEENHILTLNINNDYVEHIDNDDIVILDQFRPFGWEIEEHTYPAYEINIMTNSLIYKEEE